MLVEAWISPLVLSEGSFRIGDLEGEGGAPERGGEEIVEGSVVLEGGSMLVIPQLQCLAGDAMAEYCHISQC